MKIKQLFEGYFNRLDLDRKEDERFGIKRSPEVPKKAPEDTNRLYYLELWYDNTGYFVKTVAPTLKKAQANALFKVKKYIKANYPRYDVTGLRKDQVLIDIIPEDKIKMKELRLISV